MTKAVCPKCGSTDLSWQSGIATCNRSWPAEILIDTYGNRDVRREFCGWRGTYPARIDVLEPEEGKKNPAA